jgi:hypothetical protein
MCLFDCREKCHLSRVRKVCKMCGQLMNALSNMLEP